MDNIIDIGKYFLSGLVMTAAWIWKESSKKTAKESNIHNALEALKTQLENSEKSSKLEITNLRIYFEDKIKHLEKELHEQKQEKKELENKIYKKIETVEGLVSKSHDDINKMMLIVTKIATIQKIEVE
jgi:K+ transporter